MSSVGTKDYIHGRYKISSWGYWNELLNHLVTDYKQKSIVAVTKLLSLNIKLFVQTARHYLHVLLLKFTSSYDHMVIELLNVFTAFLYFNQCMQS